MRRLLLLLVGAWTLFDLGCVLTTEAYYTRPVPVPAAVTQCTLTLRHVESSMERTVSTSTAPFATELYSCPDTAAHAEALWLRYVTQRRLDICETGSGLAEADRMFFCQPGTYCATAPPSCTPRTTSNCTPVPAADPVPLCLPSTPPPEMPRLRVEDAAGLEVTRYDFASLPVGETRTVRLHLKNVGGGILVVRPPSIAQWMADRQSLSSFPVPATDCSPLPGDPDETIAGGALIGAGRRAECTVDLRFAPNTDGAKRVLLQVPYNDGADHNIQLEIVGQGLGGRLTLVPADLDPTNPGLAPNLCFNVPRVGGCYERPLRVTAVGAQVRLRQLILPAGYSSVPPRIDLPDPIMMLPDNTLTLAAGETRTILIRWCGAGMPGFGTIQLNTNAAAPSVFLIRALPPATMCTPLP